MAQKEFRVVVVAPVYRDWGSASVLCRELDEACSQLSLVQIRILMVDDGSADGLQGWDPFTPRFVKSIEVLSLKRNLGHQRAIATGLCYVHDSAQCDAVVVMDADGEDRPGDAIRLIRRAMEEPQTIFFAERRRRVESRVFRTGYHLYRLTHWILTGVRVRVGNFSVLPFGCLKRLVCMSEMWNHYAGAVFRSKLPIDRIPTDRGPRYRGHSRMDLISLVNHGLAGIAGFHDIVATRILICNVVGVLAVLTALIGVVAIRFCSHVAIPGWATYAAGLLLVLLAQLTATSFSLVFALVVNRTNLMFVPARDCHLFIDRLEVLWSAPHESETVSLRR